MNKSHFRKGMNDLAQTLDTVTPSKSSREEAIKQAKAQIIELFMDETTKFNTHADVDKGFTYLFQLVKNKQANSK